MLGLVAVTVTPGSTPPWLSLTYPLRLLPVGCASAQNTLAFNTTSTQIPNRKTRLMAIPPANNTRQRLVGPWLTTRQFSGRSEYAPVSDHEMILPIPPAGYCYFGRALRRLAARASA